MINEKAGGVGDRRVNSSFSVMGVATERANGVGSSSVVGVHQAGVEHPSFSTIVEGSGWWWRAVWFGLGGGSWWVDEALRSFS
ncbi:hypothetical protein Dimus_011126, partial [Dionaea muscipula]